MIRARLAAALLVALGASCQAGPAAAVSGPFAWSGVTWCPTFMDGPNGACNSTQADHNNTVSFPPSQVSVDASGDLRLALDGNVSGAASSFGYTYMQPGQIASATMDLPCDAAGRVENWPAFWLMGAQPWPANGEIDVMDGLTAGPSWGYHYLNAAGQKKAAFAAVPGNWCGWHTFAVDREPGSLTFLYDGQPVHVLTGAQIGVPLASGPMYLIVDYGQGFYGGPDASPAAVIISSVEVASP